MKRFMPRKFLSTWKVWDSKLGGVVSPQHLQFETYIEAETVCDRYERDSERIARMEMTK